MSIYIDQLAITGYNMEHFIGPIILCLRKLGISPFLCT